MKLDPVAATVVLDGRGSVLLLWRHRFATDTWNWEIPSGIVEPGETPVQAAAREAEEETGWHPGTLRELVYVQPIGGMTNAEHHVLVAGPATHIGDPTDTHEADRVEWVSLSRIPEMIADRDGRRRGRRRGSAGGSPGSVTTVGSSSAPFGPLSGCLGVSCLGRSEVDDDVAQLLACGRERRARGARRRSRPRG